MNATVAEIATLRENAMLNILPKRTGGDGCCAGTGTRQINPCSVVVYGSSVDGERVKVGSKTSGSTKVGERPDSMCQV